MKRILLSGILAVLIHALLLGIDFSFLKVNINKGVKSHVITMSLNYQKKKKLKSNPSRKKQRKIEKPSPKPIKPKKKTSSPKKVKSPEKPDKKIALKTESLSDKKHDITEKKVNDYKRVEIKNNVSEKLNEKEDRNAEKHSDTNILPIIEASPRYLDNTPPIYPIIARRRGYEGTVVLDVLVDKNGMVSDLRVFISSGYEILDSAALSSVKKWLFEPGLIGNEKKEMWVRVPICFQLK